MIMSELLKHISVIVPAYNVEQYIGRCLDSILGQTYTRLEILVVDDGSTDATGSIVDEYARKDDRIKVIHQKNRGLSGARNSALKLATGDYLGFVDGDDFIESTMYEQMLSACEEHGAQICGCAYRKVNEDGEPIESSRMDECNQADTRTDTYVMSAEEALDAYVMDNRSFHMYNSVWSKLYKNELVKGELFPEGRNSEDIVYTGKALANCSVCAFVDEPLYNYVINRSGSIMNDQEKLAKRRFEDELPFWEEQIGIFEKKGFSHIAELAKYQLCRRELFYYMEFRAFGMKAAATRLVTILNMQKDGILTLYNSSYISKGDLWRLRLFYLSPNLYYLVNRLYTSAIVPIKARQQGYKEV